MVWACVEKYFHVVTQYQHRCGTHVHVSPPDGFETTEIMNMARFLVVSYAETTQFIPMERRRAPYAKCNFLVRPAPALETLTSNLSLEQLFATMMAAGNRPVELGARPSQVCGVEFLAASDFKGDNRISTSSSCKPYLGGRVLDSVDFASRLPWH